ncbi:MAG: hypothetical protein IPN26_06685 [Bacteroidetes bacterium]|nr:hypothetical protein [Bacteroidota bacterium]
MKYILISIIILFSFDSQSQSNALNISLATSTTKISRAGHTRSILNQQSLSTSVRVFKNIELNIVISKWNSKNIGYSIPNYISYGYPNDTTQLNNWKFRQIKYKFIDLMIGYKLNLFQNTTLFLGLGPSFAFGTDNIIYQYYLNPSPPNDLLIWTRNISNKQIGIVAKANPSYHILKKRINIGVLLQFRYYPNTLAQREIGITIGYNFLQNKQMI